MEEFEIIDKSKITSDKVVLFDVDGVLLDFWTPFYYYWRHEMRQRGEAPTVKRFSKEEIYGYYRDPKSASGLGGQFEKSEVFGYLHPKKDMVETIHALKDAGYDLVVITAASPKKEIRDRRVNNLHRVFGDVFNQIHCVGSASKENLIKEYASLYKESAFCDDAPSNVSKSVGKVTYPIWRYNKPMEPLLECMGNEKYSVMRQGSDLLNILKKPLAHQNPVLTKSALQKERE